MFSSSNELVEPHIDIDLSQNLPLQAKPVHADKRFTRQREAEVNKKSALQR